MRFLPGKTSLSDVSGGTLGSGIVPLDRAFREWTQHTTAGSISVTTSTTVLITGASIDVVAGETLHLQAVVRGTKATQGSVALLLNKSTSTATFEDINPMGTLLWKEGGAIIANTEVVDLTIQCTLRVLTSGTFIPVLQAVCGAGTLATLAGEVYLNIHRWR